MNWQVVGIVIVMVCVVSFIYTEIEKRMTFSRYESLFSRGDFEGCLRLLDRRVVRLVYPKYNRLFMRLNAQMCLDDADESRRIIDEMLGLMSTEEQRCVLLLRAFNFFVEQEDYARAKELLEELRKTKDVPAEQLAECERTYAIFAEKSSAYVREMEERLRSAKDAERATLLYLLSVQYENRGDAKRANEYLERAQDQLAGMPGMPGGAAGVGAAAPSGDAGAAAGQQ